MCFYGNVQFKFFCGKMHLAVLTGKCVSQFLWENVFSGSSGKMYLQKKN